MAKRHALTKDADGCVLFSLEVLEQNEVYVEIKVFESVAWPLDEKESCEEELYLVAQLKFDGCSHIEFGEDDNNGYIHMCGKMAFKRHIEMMEALYKWAQDAIPIYEDEHW